MRSIALIDVNNFYASCEAVFNPKLEGKAVVVLSNNDGCVIARNAVTKALGVSMGAPWFKLKDLAKQHKIIALSSNYALYADMSNRVMSILSQYSPNQEVYSIDESFLDLTGINKNLIDYSQDMRSKIKLWTGLPVCVGVGSSKTLAKLANHIAKKRPEYNGVCNLNLFEPHQLDRILSEIPIGEVWGIGRKLVPRLNGYGVHTVQDLKLSDPEYLRQQFSVVMEKTIRELNGNACIELEEVSPAKQQILSSRSFGVPVRDLESLSESVSLYVSRACEKLRKQKSYAGAISVYIRTSPFSDEPKYSNTRTVSLPSPTDDTRQLVSVALWILKGIYKSGYKYQKAGIMLANLVPAEGQQTDLFGFKPSVSKSDKLMVVMDEINRKMGKRCLRVSSQGYKQPWAMKQERKSKSFTTKWDELIIVTS
jgi:DNA polymerase V